MVNPFDHNFFKFLGGFFVIITLSFVFLYFVQRYEVSSGGLQTASGCMTGVDKC